MLEVTIDLDWADERHPFVRNTQDFSQKDRPMLRLTLTDDLKLSGSVANLRELAAQIIAACDTHYPLETAVTS
jgi:hypothetical protein